MGSRGQEAAPGADPDAPKGWIRTTRRAVVREASYLVGYQHICAGWQAVRRNWQRARSRGCPKCGKSVLFPFTETYDGNAFEALGCGRCDYFEFVANDANPQGTALAREAAEVALQAAGGREARERHFQRASRIFFALALICLLVSIVLLICGNSLFLTATLLGMLILLRALVASYRCWQLREDRLFKPGSFKVWIKSGAWFV